MLPRTNILATGRGITRGSNAYIQSPVQQTPYTNDRECDLSYISLDLFMTDMLLEKLLTFPHAVNQILPLIFFIYKKILFLCIVFLDTCCQNFSKKISSSSILIYCSYPKHYQFFSRWVL